MHNENLLKEAVEKVNGYQLFNNIIDPDCALLWSVISDCYKACSALPTRTLLANELLNRVSYAKGLSKEQMLELFNQLMNLDKAELKEEVGRLFLDSALKEILKSEWSTKLSKASDLNALKRAVKDISLDVNRIALNNKTDIDDFPLINPSKYLKKQERIPLGIHFWDEMAGGGIAGGEVFGLLGPTGGGKTVLSVSIMVGRAMRGQHVNLYQYEQSLEGDLMERICTKITNLPISTFRNKGWDELADDVKLRYLEGVQRIAKYAHPVSLACVNSGGSGGSEEIINHVLACDKKGRRPSLIVIDWLGAMVQRYNALNNITGDAAYRRTAARFQDEIKRFCETEKIACIIIHQTRTDEARASYTKKPKATDAHEHKSFSFTLDACYCLGNIDPQTKIAWFTVDKNRRGPRESVLVKLDGEMQEFRDASGDFIVDHRGRFMPKDGENVPDGYALLEDLTSKE